MSSRSLFHIQRSHLSSLLAAWALCSHASVAHAQDSAATADVLFNDARAAMAIKKYDVACSKFRESNRLDPAVGTLFNLANCEQRRGQLVTASTLYRQVIEKLGSEDPRISIAKDQVRTLDGRIPRLTIRARGEMPAGTVVKVAGLALSPASFNSPLPLNPGLYAISVASPGRSTQEFSVALAEGDVAEFPVFVGKLAPAAPVPAVRDTSHSQPVSAGQDNDRKNRELFAYAGVGVGAAAFTLGVVTGLIGLHQETIGNANCNDTTRTCSQRGYDANQTAKSLAAVSTVGFVAGVLSGGVGTYLWLTLPSDKEGEVGVGGSAGATLVQWRSRW